jgi:hypothetical protein
MAWSPNFDKDRTLSFKTAGTFWHAATRAGGGGVLSGKSRAIKVNKVSAT